MKITIEIDDQVDDPVKITQLLKSDNMASALFDITQLVRKYYKYGEYPEETFAFIEKFRDEVIEILHDNDLDVDKLNN